MRSFIKLNNKMSETNNYIAIILARGGSKGIKFKNLFKINNKPLIYWSIRDCLRSKKISSVWVSSDNLRILKYVKKFGARPILRPKKYAGDNSSSESAWLHAVNFLEAKNIAISNIVGIQPTSPLRESKDIDQALELMQKNNISAVVSVCSSKKPLHWHFTLESDGKLKQIYKDKIFYTNRQELPITYSPNGALYIAKTDYFRSKKTFYTDSTLAYLMPYERSVDIDNRIDFITVEAIIS